MIGAGKENKMDKKNVEVIRDWLKSRKPTLAEGGRIYFLIPANGLEYIYSRSIKNLVVDPMNPQSFVSHAIYSPEKKICLLSGSLSGSTEEPEGFYNLAKAQKRFNDAFANVFTSLFFEKNKDKVSMREEKNAIEVFTDLARKTYLRGEEETPLLEDFRNEMHENDIFDFDGVIDGMEEADPKHGRYWAIINFLEKGGTEEGVKEFAEKAIQECEKCKNEDLARLHNRFLLYLRNAKTINALKKSYIPTESEKLTKNISTAYNAFFKGKTPPRSVKVTVLGNNERLNYPYKTRNIDIQGKIITLKLTTFDLSRPWMALEISEFYTSDFKCNDINFLTDYNGRIKKPLDCVRAEDILKIEYGRKTVWENPTSAQKVK